MFAFILEFSIIDFFGVDKSQKKYNIHAKSQIKDNNIDM